MVDWVGTELREERAGHVNMTCEYVFYLKMEFDELSTAVQPQSVPAHYYFSITSYDLCTTLSTTPPTFPVVWSLHKQCVWQVATESCFILLNLGTLWSKDMSMLD